MKFLQLPKRPVELPSRGTFPRAVHLFDRRSVDAINAALASNRPLLVRGDPGTGKSQLARAAAEAFRPKRAFVSFVVDARSEARDLHYSFDAVARLADAQSKAHEDLDMNHYVAPGPLWWLFEPEKAERQAEGCRAAGTPRPLPPPSWKKAHGMVLLIDEIDKADASLPNGLLEALSLARFDLPGGTSIQLSSDLPPPLVVITTNEERALPKPFLRRCLVLHLGLPEDKDGLQEELIRRGNAHFPKIDGAILREAARQLVQDRTRIAATGAYAPGCAEYLDLLRALNAIAPGDPEKQRDLLGRLGEFALRKNKEAVVP